jgi:hypothetical protein
MGVTRRALFSPNCRYSHSYSDILTLLMPFAIVSRLFEKLGATRINRAGSLSFIFWSLLKYFSICLTRLTSFKVCNPSKKIESSTFMLSINSTSCPLLSWQRMSTTLLSSAGTSQPITFRPASIFHISSTTIFSRLSLFLTVTSSIDGARVTVSVDVILDVFAGNIQTSFSKKND